MTALKQHHFPDGYPVEDGHLMVAGRRAEDWAAAHGTPLFIYDLSLMRQRMALTRAALPASLHLHYAMKANPHPAVVAQMVQVADGIDIASGGELRTALAAGANPASMSFAGPGKRAEELDAALAAGVTVNLESATELQRLRDRAAAIGRPARVAVRINPAIELRGAGMRMGGRPQPFGIDEDQVPALLPLLGEAPFDFQGFHVFLGSQTLSADTVMEAQTQTLELLARFCRLAPRPPRILNIGGGFGIPYFPGDLPLDVDAVGRNLSKSLAKWSSDFGTAKIVLELGRYLVGEAGVYLTRILDRKTSYGEVFLVTDGGLHHQLAASGNFGQVLRRNYPIKPANKLCTTAIEHATVVGCLCTPLDRLADRVELPRLDVGDLVAIFQAGAYGASASPAAFLSHSPATEIAV